MFWGTVVPFEVDDLCRLLEILVVPTEPLMDMVTRAPYGEIHNFLCDQHSNTKWMHRRDEKTYKTLAMEHLTKEARMPPQESLHDRMDDSSFGSMIHGPSNEASKINLLFFHFTMTRTLLFLVRLAFDFHPDSPVPHPAPCAR
ncbi:hypothetical protein HAX54_023379 [Datura stramonium]|uniref:Uncharacterized protein n=1 Tax=Datura stramonium TaxID=4076 RepID=A0ABS8S4S2_DATST|nr:hypothetical protein [Datura stramonium]